MQDIGKLGGILDARDKLGDGRRGGSHRPDRRPRPESEQPEQPCADRGEHLHGPVPRSRHDVRSDVTAGRGGGTDSSRPTSARPRCDLDSVYGGGPTRRIPSSTSPCRGGAGRGRPSSGSPAADSSRTCPATGTAARSSPTRATTRTSLSPACRPPSSCSTTRPWTRARPRPPPVIRGGVREGAPADAPGTTSG